VAVSVHDWIGAVKDAVQTLAIIAGAIWAYYKFFRGRTFARRAELATQADVVVRSDEKRAVRARVSFRNTGASDIPLRAKAVFVDTLTNKGWHEVPQWEQVAVAPVFPDEKWLDAGEVVSDEVLVPLPPTDPSDEPIAYRVRCLIYDQRKKPGGLEWTANAIITVERKMPSDSTDAS
jgi:hypothetical protein